jgi:hypothetical protein
MSTQCTQRTQRAQPDRVADAHKGSNQCSHPAPGKQARRTIWREYAGSIRDGTCTNLNPERRRASRRNGRATRGQQNTLFWRAKCPTGRNGSVSRRVRQIDCSPPTCEQIERVRAGPRAQTVALGRGRLDNLGSAGLRASRRTVSAMYPSDNVHKNERALQKSQQQLRSGVARQKQSRNGVRANGGCWPETDFNCTPFRQCTLRIRRLVPCKKHPAGVGGICSQLPRFWISCQSRRQFFLSATKVGN